jgi:hypothetical protein
MNICLFNAYFPQEPRGLSLPMIIAFHFAILLHVHRLIDLIMTQQFFTGFHDYGHLVVEFCIKTTLSDENW